MSDAEYRLAIDAEADDYLEHLYATDPLAAEGVEDELDRIEARLADNDASYPVFEAPDGTLYSRSLVTSHSRLFVIVWKATTPQHIAYIREMDA